MQVQLQILVRVRTPLRLIQIFSRIKRPSLLTRSVNLFFQPYVISTLLGYHLCSSPQLCHIPPLKLFYFPHYSWVSLLHQTTEKTPSHQPFISAAPCFDASIELFSIFFSACCYPPTLCSSNVEVSGFSALERLYCGKLD